MSLKIMPLVWFFTFIQRLCFWGIYPQNPIEQNCCSYAVMAPCTLEWIDNFVNLHIYIYIYLNIIKYMNIVYNVYIYIYIYIVIIIIIIILHLNYCYYYYYFDYYYYYFYYYYSLRPQLQYLIPFINIKPMSFICNPSYRSYFIYIKAKVALWPSSHD